MPLIIISLSVILYSYGCIWAKTERTTIVALILAYLLSVEKLVQVKFSKRKNWRIVKRWRKNPKNFAKRKQLMSMIVDHQGQKVLFVDKTTFEKIQSLS